MTHTSQGPALLLWHKAVALFANGSAAFIESCAAIGWNSCDSVRSLQKDRAASRRIHVWSPAQQMDSRANKCDVTIGNDMTSQSRKDLRRCVLSHWRFIQLSLRIVIISHWMLLHNSWTLYVSTNPSIYLHVYVVYFPRNGRIQRPHLRSVNVTVTSSWTFCFAGTTTRCSFGIND